MDREESPPRTIVSLLRADVRRGAGAALIGCAVVAVFEFVLSILVATGKVRWPTMLRFAALDVTLIGIGAMIFVPLTALVVAGPRVVYWFVSREKALAWPGIGVRVDRDGPDPTVAWSWTILLGAGMYVGASFLATLRFLHRFKEPHLIAISLAALQLALFACVLAASVLIGFGLRRAARALHTRIGRASPLGHPAAALGLLVVMTVPVLWRVHRIPTVRAAFPWHEQGRPMLALFVFVVATVVASRWASARGTIWPLDRKRRRTAMLAVAGGWFVLAPPTLVVWGANPEAKYLAVSASPTLDRLVAFVRRANDFDGDGYGSLLGENDCAPFNAKIHPGARDIPDNGIDENCNGKDFSTKELASWRKGEKMPVPADVAKVPWNILLITIDTVRYDHTSMGGYAERKGRDTTPNLKKLADEGVSFDFCNAPAAGTMASVPAIIMSKFFHEGIALGPERRPNPPKILPENTTMAEMLKRGGYHTGAIVTHEYFNDWGIEQGLDTYDNEIGAKPNPFGVSSDLVTDKAEAWIAKAGAGKWFLWTHYLDPHGRYVPHPGHTQYGSPDVEEDIYDGELAFTDEYIGKLLDFLQKSPAGKHTIVIVTSDHGDGFMEHGFINHGTALYRELLNVPLIIYIPDSEPHTVEGPVSNLDIFPTLADITGIDISDLGVEGESLVPQLFYGRDAKDRIVFSETNIGNPAVPLRAAISNDYKLIFNLKNNLYELYDLHADPWEKKNLWGHGNKDAEAKMKGYLDEWLDRSYYSRTTKGQAAQVRSNVLLSAAPKPHHPTDTTAAGVVQVVGFDLDKASYRVGDTATVTGYFKSVAETDHMYNLELSVIGDPVTAPAPAPGPVKGTPPPVAPPLAIRAERIPADGTFPTNRWHTGEYVKETFILRIPAGWNVSALHLGARLLDEKRQPAPMTGPQAGDGKQAILGDLPFDATAQIAPAPTPTPTVPGPIVPAPKPSAPTRVIDTPGSRQPLAPQPLPTAPDGIRR